MAKEEKKMENGYTSFRKEDIRTEDNRNSLAETYFLQMLDIPGRAAKKVKKGKEGELTDEDFYPCTQKETEDMEVLLQKAEATLEDRSDTELTGHLQEMRGVIEWSKKRHWEFAWWIVICVFIMGGYYWREASLEAKTSRSIERWSKETAMEKLQAELAQKEATLTYNKNNNYHTEYWEEKVQELKSLSPEEYKMLQLKAQNKKVWRERSSALWCFAWVILYILAVRPYGYMITKRRKETAVYGGLKRFLFGVAGAMFGAASALQFTEVITTWSDGSKTRGDDGSGPVILVLKIGLVVGAILLVFWVARIVIVIATILGFIRNYDLLAIAQHTAAKAKQLKNKPLKS